MPVNKESIYEIVSMEVYKDGKLQTICDPVVSEKELLIFVDGKYITTISCSPAAIFELGIGYLIGQGLISSKHEVNSITCTEEDELYITTINPQEQLCLIKTESNNNQITKYSIEQKLKYSKKLTDYDNQYDALRILELIEELDSKALTFKKTGGVHSAALGNKNGLLIRYEDIGRHNAVDKVLGHALLHDIPLNDKCLVLSGRISSEIILKASINGIAVIVSRSAPTLLAIKMASEVGMTVVGFARGNRFNVYSHSNRIKT